ncbi:High cysteine protein [Giardia duodenalis]|uniref:High cysteine protein n=1 Tax=Giardia intestinalis (strain ATCC 50803 / WB clone C6) TaxID=184922 RepID=A8BY79_GIAIC|nr:High cysteine protein [Giardia intestinalis]KAE8301285.1 High cysteine protein [Giardia intestinalis]|eukprot:XP_001704226.1 Variant-specific surface protein [Giardia lamblia ATCC 50803]
MGVEGCATCTKSDSNKGAATCTACQAGYYKDSQACSKCDGTCLTCDGSGQNQCTSCPEGKYLKGDKTCVTSDQCTSTVYPDPESGTCKECSTIDQACTTCKYNATVSKPQCTACNNNKKVKTAIDGITTCVDISSGCEDADHFKADGDAACVLCSDTSGSDPKNKGIAGCKACTKTASANPTCSECLEGYKSTGVGSVTCTPCHANCATCSAETAEDKCLTCKTGFFLVEVTQPAGKCVSCSDTNNGGIDGCVDTLQHHTRPTQPCTGVPFFPQDLVQCSAGSDALPHLVGDCIEATDPAVLWTHYLPSDCLCFRIFT